LLNSKIGDQRLKIRSSELFQQSIRKFEDETRQELDRLASEVNKQLRGLANGKTAAELPVANILEVIGTKAFRDLSISLENATFPNPGASTLAEEDLELGARVINEKIQIIGHRWAVFIHGRVQTRVSAAALMIEEANKAGDSAAISEAIKMLNEILNDPASGFGSHSQSLEDEITARLNPWEGLLDVELAISPELSTQKSPRNQDIGEVIGEAISNAVRHGLARKLTLNIAPLGENNISITIEDDATEAPPNENIKMGLGTKIFESVSDGRWELKRSNTESKTILTVVISLDGTAN
jgi:two-component sensor histidine kinase